MLRRLLLLAVILTAVAVYGQHSPKSIKNDTPPRQTGKPIPLPDSDETWLRARSKHFVFISSADEKRTRAVAEQMETLASALTQVDSTFSAPSATPARIILFARPGESQPYFEMLTNRRDPEVSSVFVSQPDGGAMLINQESMLINPDYRWRGGDRSPLHELLHYLMQSAEARPPLWLEEGIAECFSNAVIRRGSIAAGEAMHVNALRRGKPIPPHELFDAVAESAAYKDPASQPVFYAESWAIVDWLLQTSRANGAEFRAFVHDLSHGIPVEIALQARYHCSLRDLDWALSRYSAQSSAWARQPSAWVITIPAQAIDTAFVMKPLDRASTLYELGRLLAGMVELPADAERHFRAAIEANPHHARALAALAALRCASAKYAEAMPLFEQAIAADPDDVEVALAYAEALMQDQRAAPALSGGNVDDDITRFRKARSLVQRTLAHRSDAGFPVGRAIGDLGMTFSVENDVTPGIAALEEARKLLPGRTDFTLQLLAMYRRSGNRTKADPLAAQLEATHKPEVSGAARIVIERADVMRANALTQEQHFDEAAVIVHELAASTEDADARSNFEKQAADLRRAAEQNRQIDTYNRIVAQVNAGKYREAIGALTEFLPTATDPDIVRDARKLQKDLAKWKP